MIKSNAPYIALAAVCLIWGTTYMASKVTLAAIAPLSLCMYRQTIAGSVLLGYVYMGRKKLHITTDMLRKQALNGFLMITVGNGFSTLGVKYIPTGLAALLGALVPLFAIFIEWLMGKGIPNRWVWLGTLLGLGGLAIISRHQLDWQDNSNIWGFVLVLGACLTWTIGTIYTKYLPSDGSVLLRTALQMLWGGVFLIPLSFWLENPLEVHFTPTTFGAIVYLIVFGSLIAFNAFNYALLHLPLAVTSLYTYINPVIALVAGWLFLHESLDALTIAACVLTLLGVYIVKRFSIT